MDPIVETLVKDNNRYHYWQQGDKMLIAVSGGVDSMALLAAFLQLPASHQPEIFVLHVHHHLRPEADLDCQLVETYCQKHHIPYYIKHWHPSEHPVGNIEAAGRKFRYEFFAEKMIELQATHLLTAHHADDQMETILMRLTRGSTLSGYAGIQKKRKFQRGQLLRPLLEIEKEELYKFCERQNIPFREDASNKTQTYTRNRYREQVIPFIKAENSKAAQHFQTFSTELSTVLDVVYPVVAQTFAHHFTFEDEKWLLQLETFQKEQRSMQKLLLSYFFQEKWQAVGIHVQQQHVEQILELIESSGPQATYHVSGGLVSKRYQRMYFSTKDQEKKENHQRLDFDTELIENEWLDLPFNGKIGLFSTDSVNGETKQTSFTIAQTPESTLAFPLYVRFWKPGDRIQMNRKAPFTKKISRLFIDQKIPHEQRNTAVVVVDQSGEILWVPGFAYSKWLIPLEDEPERIKNNMERNYQLIHDRND